jgi:hypothetical protein
MPTVNITGTIQDASGNGVQYAVIRLSPVSANEDEGEVIGGVGIVRDVVEVLTDADGAFTMPAVQGFQYALSIPSLGMERVFRAPSVVTVAFHTLGLSPTVTGAPHGTDADGAVHYYPLVTVPLEATVRERFDELVLERSEAIDGPWTEVTRWTLLAGKSGYKTDDAPGDVAAVYYRAYYEHSVSGDLSGESDVFSAAEEVDETLVFSVDDFKKTYLSGLDLSNPDGTPFAEQMFTDYIRAAVDWLEKALDICIAPREFEDETHDHFAQDYGQWGFFKLHHWPIIQMREVAFQYPSMDERVTIDADWVILEEGGETGVVQLVPGRGGISDVLFTPGSLMPLWSGGGRVPGVWKFTYRAGFELGQVPPLMKHCIGMVASLGVMNVAGDLVGGSGLQGWSVTIPGLSQNITTTNSSTNAGFGARIIQYEKDLKLYLPVLKAHYGKTMKLVVV